MSRLSKDIIRRIMKIGEKMVENPQGIKEGDLISIVNIDNREYAAQIPPLFCVFQVLCISGHFASIQSVSPGRFRNKKGSILLAKTDCQKVTIEYLNSLW